jgi:hypothetical protein
LYSDLQSFRYIPRSGIASCSLSFVEYRPNTNVAILWNTGHTKGRSHMRGIGKIRTWIGLMYPVFKTEYRNLNLTETTIRKGLREGWGAGGTNSPNKVCRCE